MQHANLVIMPFGRNSLISDWIRTTDGRQFDLVLLAYHPLADLPNLDTATVYEYNNFKWWMIWDFFADHPDFAKKYTSFYFIDDDIETNLKDINQLFYIFNQLPFLLAQPSLSFKSYYSWKALRHRPLSGYRLTNTVELMCPLMKREALQLVMPTFKLTKSGWGIDLLWGHLIKQQYGDSRIAVIDYFKVHHSRPVGKGELYTKIGKSAHDEAGHILADYKLGDLKIEEARCSENSLIGRWRSYMQVKKLLQQFSGLD